MPDGGFDPHAEQAHAATGLEMAQRPHPQQSSNVSSNAS
ncbi:hypothetical protein TIFTF001_026889 [Ficus carica]|uniref:Uncharacterized protein n=1 Tax=Ficus carica TaxID=3494 RepID=A0AA88IZB6_FICCA|nr:hypothetical protein TIFTF001_026889 [Ficus carica]